MKQDFKTIINGFSDGQYVTISCVQNMKTLFMELGKIISIGNNTILVEFVLNIQGHSGLGRGKEGHCWEIEYENISYIEINETYFYIEKFMK